MKTQSISFGKTPVMKCIVKEVSGKNKHCATLYQMDTKNPEDFKEIKYSKSSRCLIPAFQNDISKHNPAYNYYLLKNDTTGEVISCAQTSKRFKMGSGKYSGMSTLIDEMVENTGYLNGGVPLLAYLAHKSEMQSENFVSSALRLEDTPSLKIAKFTKLRNGDWFIPKNRYQLLIDIAEKRVNALFLDTVV